MVNIDEHKGKSSNIWLIFIGVFWLIFGIFILAVTIFRPSEIEVIWQTETEFQTAGFNIYRSEDRIGPFEKVNESVIPSSSDAATGGTYTFLDASIQRGTTYFYQLEDVEFDNSTRRHDPIIVTAPSISWINITLAGISLVIGLIIIGAVFWRNRNVQ